MATMKKVVWKDGTVSYKISFIHPHNNKWTSKSVRCSYKDALKIKADIEKDVAFGKIGKENPDFRKVFFSQLKTKYIKDSKRNKTTKTTPIFPVKSTSGGKLFPAKSTVGGK